MWTWSLTSRAGPWSHMPTQLAHSSVKQAVVGRLVEVDAELASRGVGDGVLAGEVARERAAEADDEAPSGAPCRKA